MAEIVVVYNILIPLIHALTIVMGAGNATFSLVNMLELMLLQMRLKLVSFTAFLAQERPYVNLFMLKLFVEIPYVTLQMNRQVRHGRSRLEATVPVLVNEGANHRTSSIDLKQS